MKRFLYSLFVYTLTLNHLPATPPKEAQETKRGLRISELLPNLLTPLSVDPAIPSDFVALSSNGTLDPHNWIYWGPKEALKAYFEDMTSLKTAVLRVKLSDHVTQTGPNSFDNDTMYSLKVLAEQDPYGFAFIETQWGPYPILAIRTKIEGRLVMVAWVGLNDSEGRGALVFNLVYPAKRGYPNEKERSLWEHLIMKTRKQEVSLPLELSSQPGSHL